MVIFCQSLANQLASAQGVNIFAAVKTIFVPCSSAQRSSPIPPLLFFFLSDSPADATHRR